MPTATRSPLQTHAFFLAADDGRGGQRFCLFHPAQGGTVHGSVLYLHPFAEEMNKSRRMAALQARALAQAGYEVLQIDLLGCGDSSGDFGDAAWGDWVADVLRACHWLHARSKTRLWLWGLRSGCLLAAQAAAQLPFPSNYIFWAPTPSGKVLMQQFLRLKAASEMLAGGGKGMTETLRNELAAGEPVEVAGYMLAPGLASGMEQAMLAPPAVAPTLPTAMRLEWFEMSTRDNAVLSPVAGKTATQWADAGFLVRTHVVNGPPFWQTTEIEQAPALIAATLAALAPQHPQTATP